MTKNKKIIASIVGAVAVIGIIGSLLYGEINKAENEYISTISSIASMKDNIMIDKQELLDTQGKMVKLNKDKDKIISIDKTLEKIEKENYSDNTKLNDHVNQLDKLNKEIDNMIDIYNENENMKKDIGITKTMMSIEGLDNLIDNMMKSYNTEYAPKFNEAIKKFPVSIIAKSKGWYEVDMFSSIN